MADSVSWPQKTAIIVCEESKFVDSISSYLRESGWVVKLVTGDFQAVRRAVLQKEAYILIVLDSANLPAFYILRNFATDPVLALTPAFIGLTQKHAADRLPLTHFTCGSFFNLPISPIDFKKIFSQFLSRWEKGLFFLLRKCLYDCMQLPQASRPEILQALLIKEKAAMPFLAPAIARYTIALGKINEAEKMLLDQLKYPEQLLAKIYCLSDLYLEYSMHSTSARLINGVHNKYPESKGILVDLLNISILQGKLDLSMQCVESLLQFGYMDKRIERIKTLMNLPEWQV